MLAGSIGTAILGAFFRKAAIAFQKKLGALAPAQAAFGIVIFGQGGILLVRPRMGATWNPHPRPENFAPEAG
jgi:hypothetical protein